MEGGIKIVVGGKQVGLVRDEVTGVGGIVVEFWETLDKGHHSYCYMLP